MVPKRIATGGGLALKSELAGIIGVNRQRAAELADSPGFPEPATVTVGGKPLWRRNDVEKWNAPRSRKGGRPPGKDAVRRGR